MLTAFNGSKVPARGKITLNVTLGKDTKPLNFLVSEHTNRTILSNDGLQTFGFVLDFAKDCLRTPNGGQIFCHLIQKN